MSAALVAGIARWRVHTRHGRSTGKPSKVKILGFRNGGFQKLSDVHVVLSRNVPSATNACVVICPVGARIFGDLNDPESNVSKILRENPHYQLRENLGTGPRVYYLPAVPAKEA
jgi:Fe-S-cluster-containing dehydrogenase component